MLRFETLIYCQLIGILLLLGTYELKLLNGGSLSGDPEFDHFMDIIKYNNSDTGIQIYIQILVGLSVLLSFWRLVSSRSIIDLITIFVSVPFAVWYWTELLPLERLFSLGSPHELFYKLLGHHIVFGLFVWTLFSLSLLSSQLNYVWEPVELLIINVIAGLVVLDFTYDLPLLLLPLKASLTLQYGHVTNGIGTALLEIIVPGLLAVLLIFLLYRIYQRSIVDLLLLALFVSGGYIFVTQILPLEEALYRTGPSRTKQYNVGTAHAITLCMLIFYNSFKITLYHGLLYKLSRLPPPVPQVSAEKTSKHSSSIDAKAKKHEHASDKSKKNPPKVNSPQ